MKIHLYYVYILTNAKHTVLYTGVTNDLERRCFEHKQKKIKGFTRKYNVDKLIYFEKFNEGWQELYLDGKIEHPL